MTPRLIIAGILILSAHLILSHVPALVDLGIAFAVGGAVFVTLEVMERLYA